MDVKAIKNSSNTKMHPKFLYLRPSYHEQHYFAQLEALDLINCLIAPIFFATTLERWPRSFLAGVYCLVLAIKGYQVALLMLPTARAVHAHQKARYWLIFAERALRQFVATPALGRGPRFVQWLRDTTADNPSLFTALKQMLLICGATHAFWNTFCLPLDFISQVFFNVVFFLLHFPPIVTQVAYSVGMMVKHKPQLVWLQWGLEGAASCTAQLLLQGWTAAAAAAQSSSLGMFIPANILAAGSGSPGSAPQQQLLLGMGAAAAVALPPGRAPDLETPAGRLVLAVSTAFMVFVVLYLPLFFAFWVERHMKSRFMAAVARRSSKAGVKLEQAVPDADGSDSTTPGDAAALGSESPPGCGHEQFIHPPVVFPMLPGGRWTLFAHMVAAAAVSFMLGEAFVSLCIACPLVARMLWKQIPGA